jgi:hypothetical protein
MDKQLNRRLPTGTYCGGNHPEQIEYRYTLVDDAEVPSGQSSPRCFRAGCPDNHSALAKEQRGGRPEGAAMLDHTSKITPAGSSTRVR